MPGKAFVQRPLLLAAVVTSVFSSTFTQAAPQRDFRAYETAPALARAMLQAYPDRVKAITNPNDPQERSSILLVKKNTVTALMNMSCSMSRRCGGFVDITDESKQAYEYAHRGRFGESRRSLQLPPIERREDVSRVLNDVKASSIEAFVKAFYTGFRTRDSRTQEGKKAAEWLANQWRTMASQAGREDIKVDMIPLPSDYLQSNVRITIPGQNPQAPIVILGGHLDSTSSGSNAPGADDNASGIGALTEVYRVLLANSVKPAATIQIIGYGGEEAGLVGSRAVAESYKKAGAKVRGVLQLDMVAYAGDAHLMTFISDNVDAELSQWTEQLYGSYVGERSQHERCGYGCSDHASWTRYGFASAFPFEAMTDDMNPNIHSSRDIWDQSLNADYAAQFTKLAIAFALTLATAQ